MFVNTLTNCSRSILLPAFRQSIQNRSRFISITPNVSLFLNCFSHFCKMKKKNPEATKMLSYLYWSHNLPHISAQRIVVECMMMTFHSYVVNSADASSTCYKMKRCAFSQKFTLDSAVNIQSTNVNINFVLYDLSDQIGKFWFLFISFTLTGFSSTSSIDKIIHTDNRQNFHFIRRAKYENMSYEMDIEFCIIMYVTHIYLSKFN